MSVNKIILERDGLIVGDTQLVASGGGVTIGQNLVVAGNSYIQNFQTISGNLTVSGNTTLAGNIYAANYLGIGTATPTAKFQISGPGGSNPNFIMSGPGEQTFRFYNTSLTGSTRVSWKMASRLNTDWEWIWYTDATGNGLNDLTLANQSGTVLFADANRTTLFVGNVINSGNVTVQGNIFLPQLGNSSKLYLSPNNGNNVYWDGSGTQFAGNAYIYFATTGIVYIQNTTILRGPVINDANSGTLLLGSTSGSNVLVANAQATISPGTGALIVSGGVGVGGNLFVGGNISLVSTNPQSAVVNTRINPRFTNAAATSGTITINSDIYDQYQVVVNGTAAFAAPSGTPVDGQKLTIRVKDSGTRQTISFTTGSAGAFRGVGLTLPTVSTAAVLYLGCVYNAHDSRWDAIALSSA